MVARWSFIAFNMLILFTLFYYFLIFYFGIPHFIYNFTITNYLLTSTSLALLTIYKKHATLLAILVLLTALT